MTWKTILVPLLVVPAVLTVVIWAAHAPADSGAPPLEETPSIRAAADLVDQRMTALWGSAGVTPAPLEGELQVLRRLSLSLHGTLPSLQDIRRFEADAHPDRLLRWTNRLLQDKRFADYFSERLARGMVGVDTSPFLIFRRDRFKAWLAERLQENTPYDEIVRQVVSEQGLWTGTPATNFVTSAVVDRVVDENKLAGRSVRVFLGQRMDCAQCHDHPFARWKQTEYEGLAAYFDQVQVTFAGVEDRPKARERAMAPQSDDGMMSKKKTLVPRVPFHPEWLPGEGAPRQQLAGWITHPENRRFERAVVNRMWGYLFGVAWHDPVDDLPDPPELREDETVLDWLGSDFREHGYDLRRLILVMTSLKAFRISSAHPTIDEAEFEQLRRLGAVFPLTRLRPEQVIGSMLQAANLQSIDQNSHFFIRVVRYFRERDFVDEYGDLGDAELTEQTATITQALQRMNSSLSKEIVQGNPLNSTGRIAGLSPDDSTCLEVCFIVALTRRPTSDEAAALLPQLAGTAGDRRTHAVEDILWALFNSEEFSWNH